MTVLPIRLPDGSVLRESGGPRLYRCRCQMPGRFAPQFVCSPNGDCGVSFRPPLRSILSPVLWDLAAELVLAKRAGDTFASPAFCENRTALRSLKRSPSARPAPAV